MHFSKRNVWAAVLAILAGVSLAWAGYPPEPLRVRGNAPFAAPPLFAFANATQYKDQPVYSGLPYAMGLCDALTSADKVGPWECYSGDNTSAGWDGGTGIYTAGGSPASQTMSLCPNGPSCATVTRDVENSGDGRKSTAFASGTGSVTACWLGIVDASYSDHPILTQSTAGSGVGMSWYLEAAAGGVVKFYISDGTAATASQSAPGGAAYLLGAEHLFCGTWSAANGVIAYFDGVGGTPVAKAARQSLSAAPTIHGINGGTYTQPRIRTRGAFFTATELSAARIAQIARAVLADAPTGTRGEALTFTRATASSCPLDADESEVSNSPRGRPCITRNGIRVNRNYTELALRTSELTNAYWSETNNVGAITRTADSADCGPAPDGSLTAEKIVIPACGSSSFSVLYNNIGTLSASPYTTSVYAKLLSGDGKFSIHFWNATTQYVGGTQHTATSTWKRFATPNITLAASDSYIYIGTDTRTAPGSGAGNPTTSGTTICLWRYNLTQSAYAHPSVDATSASVAVNAEVAKFDGIVGPAARPWSAAATRVNGTLSTTAYFLGLNVSSGSRFAMFQAAGAGDLQCWNGSTAVTRTGALGTLDRIACALTATETTGCLNASCGTGAASVTGPMNSISIGHDGTSGTLQIDAIIRDVCLDTDPLRCR